MVDHTHAMLYVVICAGALLDHHCHRMQRFKGLKTSLYSYTDKYCRWVARSLDTSVSVINNSMRLFCQRIRRHNLHMGDF